MTNADQHYKKMTETPVPKLILNLGIPTTISMLITNIYNMADTYFVGTLGESAQAATGVLFTVQAIMQGIAFMFGHGGGTFIARALADKNTREATKYISSAFFVGGLIGLIITFLGLSFLDPLVRFLGATETIVPYAKDYAFFILLAAAPILFFSGFFLKEKNVLVFCVFASIACISLISAIAVIVLNYKKLVAYDSAKIKNKIQNLCFSYRIECDFIFCFTINSYFLRIF